MARRAMILKSMKEPKFKVRHRNRCKLCGRPRGYMKNFSSVEYVLDRLQVQV